MAAIAVAPIILNDCTVTIGTDTYEAALSKVQFDPSSSTVRWRGMSPTARKAFQTLADWSYSLTFAQDLVTANSLSQYLMANEGKAITMKFKPKKPATGTAPTITATILVTPGALGGDVDTIPTAAITGGVDGTPTIATE